MPLRQLVLAQSEGRMTSEQLVRASLARIRSSPAAFLCVFEDASVLQARVRDVQRSLGELRGPLAGIPLAVKDLIDVAEQPTTSGRAPTAQARIASKDAVVVERLTAAGAVLMGKTHLAELAFSGLGYNPHYETPLSPFGKDGNGRVPGGSSGGSGVAVALGLVPCAVGTDTAGSIRIPAAWCGVTGFKPTVGKVPGGGCQVLSQSFDSIGPLANCVEDCAILHRVMAGSAEPLDPLAPPHPTSLRLLIPITGRGEVETVVTRNFEGALDVLEAAGAKLERRMLPALAAAIGPFQTVVNAEAAATHADLLADTKQAATLDSAVRERLEEGLKVSAVAYLHARAQLRKLCTVFDQATAGFDAVLIPTVPFLPPKLANIVSNYEARVEGMKRVARLTRAVNALDRCAVSLPCHPPPLGGALPNATDHLPVGLMVIGESGGDEACLAVAAAVESVLRGAGLGVWRPVARPQSTSRAPPATVEEPTAKRLRLEV